MTLPLPPHAGQGTQCVEEPARPLIREEGGGSRAKGGADPRLGRILPEDGERPTKETSPRGGDALGVEVAVCGDRNYMNVTQIFQ